MMRDRSAAPVYCLPGRQACQAHRRAISPLEREINAHVGTLAAQHDSVRRALVAAIWGAEETRIIEEQFPWSDLVLSASDKGADWELLHGDRLLRVAEHKPRRAPAHWPIAGKAAYARDLLEPIEGDDWIESITEGCSLPHSAEEYRCRHPWYYRGTNQLSAPQPLAYLASARARSKGSVSTLTVVTSQRRAAKTINEIWDTAMAAWPTNSRMPSKLRADLFPIRSTTEFLRDFIDALDLDGLDDETYADVRALVEAMWILEGCPEVADAVSEVIRPELEKCPDAEGCEKVLWQDFVGWSPAREYAPTPEKDESSVVNVTNDNGPYCTPPIRHWETPMGFSDELEPVPRPVRVETNPPYFHFRETGYNAANYPGAAGLASAVRADLAVAKASGRLPRKLGTLVSLRSDYRPVLSVTVRGTAEEDLFEVAPGPSGIVGTVAGLRPGNASPSMSWSLNRDWAFVLLQVYLIADGYNQVSHEEGDDYPQCRYTCNFSVQNAVSLASDMGPPC